MTELPKSTHSGSFNLFGVDVVCHRLDNGQAIIEEDSMIRLFDAMGTASDLDAEQVAKFMAWLRGDLS